MGFNWFQLALPHREAAAGEVDLAQHGVVAQPVHQLAERRVPRAVAPQVEIASKH